MAPDASPSPAESPTALDDEIADLEAQAEALQKALKPPLPARRPGGAAARLHAAGQLPHVRARHGLQGARPGPLRRRRRPRPGPALRGHVARRQADAADAEQPPPPRQDLDRFVRALRREIVRYHNRLGVAADLRRRLGLQDMSRVADPPAHVVVDVAIADIEAKQIKLTWADDRSGRLVMDDDGRVLKLVVFGAQGRDWETAKELFGNYDRIEDIARKLEEHHGAVPG
ncbi:hypothetical protein HIM_04910 [Hirsutella minnesotensis 3608]|uniref:Uncharacterized protein n=1 Tax=Hirsutella minnesotensis 3608 TaxID=1043627 RepID=A0A0F7ZV01_9HYPO|nr:hypothetical protein HIM_04910 [Hirsutella minnesotensis 3608]